MKHLESRRLEEEIEAFRATSKRTRIETRAGDPGALLLSESFRATSKRTRIETEERDPGAEQGGSFQSDIQENKD